MAYIYKRGKTYTYSVESGRDNHGKRKKIIKGGFRTKKEAQQAAAKVETQCANGTFVFESGITAAEFAEEWYIQHAKSIKVSSSHNEKYQKDIFKNYFGEKPLKKISRKDFQIFIDNIVSRKSRYDKPYSRRTLSSIVKLAKQIFRSALEHELIAKDPTVYTSLPREKDKILTEQEALPKYLEKDQLKVFLDYTKKNGIFAYMYPLIMTLTYTGCRISEITALQWEDIDFEENTIRINKDIFFLSELKREFIFQTPKTKKSMRTIKVSKILMDVLKDHRKAQHEDKMLNRKLYQENSFVFTGQCKDPIKPYGAPLPNSRVQNFMYKAARETGFLGIHPHSLRHTHVSLLAEAGVPLEVILDRLGHADDKMVRKIYLHVTKTLKKEAVQKFDELMSS